MDGYWAHQTELQRSGGCWTAACKGSSLTLTKSLRTYMCWTKAILGNSCIYILNCYLEPGEDEQIKNRAARISEIAAAPLRGAAVSFKDSECDGDFIKRNIIILNMIRYRKVLYRNKDDERKTLEDIKSTI
jgi:hypothetical protein